MKFNQPLRFYAQALLIVASMTLAGVIFRDHLTLSNFTMFYLLTVLIIAIQYGTGPALAATFASFICINYFLVQPLYTLAVSDPRELLDLCVFVIVVGISSQLGARVQQKAEEARQYAHEQEILYRLTRSFNQLTTDAGVYNALIHAAQTDLAARYAEFRPSVTEKIGSDQGMYHLLLQSRDHIYGTLQVGFDKALSAAQFNLLNTCVFQAAQALERIDLTARANKSQQFEEADKLKTAILRAISHDLRTPITIIKTSANNLQRLQERLSTQESLEISQTIEHEADQLDQLVGNLLDMSRLQAGALVLNCHLNSPEELIGDAVARIWELTRQKRITLVFDDLPLIQFDYGLMLQAINNLVDNSLRYEPPDREIEIRTELSEAEARVKIINHGETIPADLKERIMEPFYRGKDGRTGLGLPIAKGIIEAHQGRLWVEDTPDGGATFILTLPVSQGLSYEP
jgi:two-component system, OmpR family, sensor histidine kinase KdpD